MSLLLSLRSIVLMTILVALVGACAEPPPEKPPMPSKQVMIDKNRERAKKEKRQIRQYIERHNLTMTATGTGLQYQIYEQGPEEGETARFGQIAKVHFTVSLLDGTKCYTSEGEDPEEFMIEQDDVESGLHEGIKFMRVGDKARMILPSHLAHGLVGDRKKIPPLHTIIYDIELLDLK